MTPERDQAPPGSLETQEGGPRDPSYSLPPPTSQSTPPRLPRLVRTQDRPRQRGASGYPDEMTPEQAKRIRKRKLAALAVQQILKLRTEKDRLEERLLQEFRERRQSQDLTREEVRFLRFPPVTPTTKEPLGTVGTAQPEQKQFSSSTPRQLLVYDETPTGRPLPTLQDIHQANLRRVLEEEGADTPCDICGAPDHDY